MDKQINIMDLLKLYLKRWWYIAIAVIAGGIASAIITITFVTPMYTSYGTLYTENRADILNQDIIKEVNLSTVMVRKELVATYAELLSSNTFLHLVAEESDLGYTPGQILGMLSMDSKNETEILVIAVTTANPQHSHIIAQKIIDLAPGFVNEIVEGSSAKVLDQPSYSPNPSSPNLIRNIEIGAVIGLLLSLILVFSIEMLDNKVKDVDTVSEMFKYPILGEIPHFTMASKKTSKKGTKESKKTKKATA